MNTSPTPRPATAEEQAHTRTDVLSSETQSSILPPADQLIINASISTPLSVSDTHLTPILSQHQYQYQNTSSGHAAQDGALPTTEIAAEYDHETSMIHETFEDEPTLPGEKKSMKRLTRDQRRDILLMRRLGHKYEEISRFLGVSQSAVQYTVNGQRASPEHHKAGRKKTVRTEMPKHARGRKVRKDGGKAKGDEVSAETTNDIVGPGVIAPMEHGVTSLNADYPGHAESSALLLGTASQDELF